MSLILTGTSTLLTTFAASDVDEVYLSWLQDKEVTRFSNQRFRTHSRESCEEYRRSFEGTDSLFLLVRERASGQKAGTISAHAAPPHGTADIGIMIGNRNLWGRGLGLDAWSTLMQYLLDVRALRKVTGGTLACNAGMVRIMERSGMHLEGIRRKQELIDGEPQDVLYYARFRDPADF